MRPLRLELKGFTAFRDGAELDFTQLDVFAISGPTGSGKSSLLDAVTYALYGRVERVGDRVSQLISQGQPRMSVTLEFEVGAERYRVTRSTPAAGRGATKILVERQDPGAEWVQAGDGADRVREADRILERAVGLTYDGFTRSVLLPQGKFAEFLVGDAKKRRDILTELLGLSLFRRMAERAGSIAKEAGDRSRWTSDMLASEFADATDEALEDARAAVRDATRREVDLARAAAEVGALLARSRAVQQAATELAACAHEARTAADSTQLIADELGPLAERLADADAVLEGSAIAAAAAREALAEAQASLTEADATLGTQQALADASVRADRLADAVAARQTLAAAHDAAAAAASALTAVRDDAAGALRERRVALAAREAELREADSVREAARHADLVAAVSADLAVGDPCPVCGVPLERAPLPPADGVLAKAQAAFDDATRALDAARSSVAGAERAADAAWRDTDANALERERLEAQIVATGIRIAGERAGLVALLGDPLPDHPGQAVQRRLADRGRIADAERAAADRVSEGAQDLLRAENARAAVAGAIDQRRARLAGDNRPLVDRAARALGSDTEPPEPPVELPVPAGADDPIALLSFAERLAASLAGLADALLREMEVRATAGERLLDTAAEAVHGLVGPARSLEELADAVTAAGRDAAAGRATATTRVEDLIVRLERKRELTAEVTSLDGRARVFRSLSQELDARHIIPYLQAEALQVLATAGAQRLSSLSDGRYRLVCREDEFLVVDTWNGDEERSVRTLSGGETFLASLALSLALADQVRSLSSTDRAKLDSLFLDEGFGTLDQEALQMVVDAIELLAGDGRLVGVITHVPELAERFPRIQVEKSPRGSHLRPLLG